jgi:hypothetical protein
MNLPAKGTTERMILDFVCTAKSRRPGAICLSINHVNKNTVLRLIAALKADGMLREDGAGVTLTAKSKALYREAEKSVHTEYTMRPLSAKHIASPLGLREGSNDYRAWQSKHV